MRTYGVNLTTPFNQNGLPAFCLTSKEGGGTSLGIGYPLSSGTFQLVAEFEFSESPAEIVAQLASTVNCLKEGLQP